MREPGLLQTCQEGGEELEGRDAAERGVKFATDYKDDAKLELRYQNVLQVVELDKAIVPNQRKTKQRFNK